MKLGLTGGIGSGKSAVAARLQHRGAHLVDADALSRALTAPAGAALPAIRATWGPEMLDERGALDRGRMRARVFADAAEKARLESILHPLIAQAVWEGVRQAQAADPGGLIVMDIPLLAESTHWWPRLDAVLVIDCQEETQVRRVVARSGLTREQVRAIMAQQASRAARRAIADHIICNDGADLQVLHDEVDAWWQAWNAQRQAASMSPD